MEQIMEILSERKGGLDIYIQQPSEQVRTHGRNKAGLVCLLESSRAEERQASRFAADPLQLASNDRRQFYHRRENPWSQVRRGNCDLSE